MSTWCKRSLLLQFSVLVQNIPYLSDIFCTCWKFSYLLKNFHTFLVFKTRFVNGLPLRPSLVFTIMANSLLANVASYLNSHGQSLEEACALLERNQNCTDYIVAEELSNKALWRAEDLHYMLVNSDNALPGLVAEDNVAMAEFEAIVGDLYNFFRRMYEYFENIALRQEEKQFNRDQPKLSVSLSQVSGLRLSWESWAFDGQEYQNWLG